MSLLATITAGEVLFGLAAAVALLAAVVAVTRRNPVYSVLALLVMFGSLAVLFLLLRASFLAGVELFLYAGAIMTLFVFVLMLLRLTPEDLRPEGEPTRQLAIVLGLGVFLIPLGVWLLVCTSGPPAGSPAPGFGSTVGVAREHFPVGAEDWSPYILPFEILSVLLIAAIVGAIVLAWRRRPDEE